jgi:hypothetical protein
MPYKLKGNCVVKADSGAVVKCHKTKAQALAHLKALKVNVTDASFITLAASSIEALQKSKPLLTTVADVQIIKTGIEYPLSSGPCTFTPEDLAAAVAAQNDPSVPQPRIWIGHPDDTRIHGDRMDGTPSGEPAVGKVTDMRLTEDGHCVVGDLSGVPVWLANILSSAFPSRSIEGRFNVKTPTGKKHRLVINGLALLGVVWPGVLTLDDIASLYTEKGPEITLTAGTEQEPITVRAAAARQLSAQVTVEDLRRMWYESNRGDPDKFNWWIRSIYIDPNELIIDADDGGTLLRQPFSIKKDKVKFLKPKRVKIKYVNASHGGVEAEPVNENRTHIATFEQKVLQVKVPTGNFIDIKLKGKN